ncbi:hypothetical protein [Halomonas koreensis]|uniref:Uncharacterized protein n=1 Tax=Halomonas koreensis TaxID=245385 RepID=A0ABU1G5V6_9GAMM|nr:hypothetical protein [Halomonas koreensis]MDR5868322.1 hypothetical protein [Halomonas koreensis]
MRRRLLAAGLALWLAGCATAPPPAVPATRTLEAAPAAVLEEAMALLMARGYVIRHADVELGRLEAVIARWPGYRLRLRVAPAEAGSRLAITAHRGDRPLPPALAEPLIAALGRRLSARP